MKSTGKAKLIKGESELQASSPSSRREMPAKAKRGFKRPPRRELEEIIRLVNLLPPNPPPLPLTADGYESLPCELQDYLGEYGEVAFGLTNSSTDACMVLEWKYKEIIETREALWRLVSEAQKVSGKETIHLRHSINAPAFFSIGEDRRVKVYMSTFVRAIDGAEIDYLRYCETCRNIFYAGRKNQPCCSVKCAKAQRQKRWRQKYNEGQPAYHK
jgi:hypothetical protein